MCMCFFFFYFSAFLLTLILLTWRIWWAPNNANRWQMGFNSAFKGLSWLWFFHPWHPSKRQIVLFCKKEWKEQGRLTWKNKMSVIWKMEASEKCANACSSLGLAPATISTTVANAGKIKQSAQKNTKFHASNIIYTRNFDIEKMEQLLTPWVVDLIWQMDTSGVSLKEYWRNYNLLKAIDNIKMAWEEVTVLCVKGVWHIIWPSNKNYGTNFVNLDMLIKEISEVA